MRPPPSTHSGPPRERLSPGSAIQELRDYYGHGAKGPSYRKTLILHSYSVGLSGMQNAGAVKSQKLLRFLRKAQEVRQCAHERVTSETIRKITGTMGAGEAS